MDLFKEGNGKNGRMRLEGECRDELLRGLSTWNATL